MIYFNKPLYVPECSARVAEAIEKRKICGDGEFTKKSNAWLEKKCNVNKALLTTSCTHALEMSAILCNIKPGDEVIMPSYTFVSTADAFVMRGAEIVFVDIRPDTMNIDENLIEEAITSKTKAIVPVHYAGVGCEMDKITELALKYNLDVVEDDAQGIMSTYKGKPLGSFGRFGCLSFHETKNYTMGEGGALLINNMQDIERAEIIREKGTNRSKFFRGEIDKYTWVDCGSSYLPSEINAAYLYGQLMSAEQINEERLVLWNKYYDNLSALKDKGCLDLPFVPDYCTHNAHMFYIKVKDLEERTKLIDYLRKNDVYAVFHYIPLHSSPAGFKYGHFSGADNYTTKESERLLRLPMYYGLKLEEIDYISEQIVKFYS